MTTNKLYATKEAVTVSYGNKDYRIQTDSIYDAFINEYNDLIEIYKSTLAPPPNPTITNAPK